MMKCQNMRNSNCPENQEPVNSLNHENNPPDLSALVNDEDFVEFTTPTIDKTCQDLLKDWGSNSILMPIIGNI
uniref:Uncharacterized protein n=1 Tax=Acrobeloides nanus TaxID=290746 RepID=A0A914DTK6_9BILA